MAFKQPAVHIMASHERGTLYVGVTGNLKFRVWQHRESLGRGFTKRYDVKHLVWFEHHTDFPSAITREKQLKKWTRAWKLQLIETANPTWRDLWENLQD